MKLPGLVHALLATASLLLAGCQTTPAVDYTAFIKARPASLLVLPPVNESPDLKATPGVWAHATRPLAEAGYYVMPIALVDETFRNNGIQAADEAQQIAYPKLREFFGADAAVYLRVKKYGSTYAVLASETRVEVEGRLVDLRSGEQLWQGSAWASSSEQQQAQGGLIGALVSAVVQQVMSQATDASFRYAAIAGQRLFAVPRYNGLLAGPRSPLFGQPPVKP